MNLPTPSRRNLLRGALAAGAAGAAGLAAAGTATAGSAGPGSGAPRSALRHSSRTPRAGVVDYPGAQWLPASTANYTAANRPSTYPVNLVVIHVTQETFDDTITLFQDPNHAACSHYVVRSADGHIGQCVREHDVAWHAGNWDYNTRSIGIEHEGWVDKPQYFTDALYSASAKLTASVCARYDIPVDRTHIIGHSEVPGTDHTDPGQYWDWSKYMALVKAV